MEIKKFNIKCFRGIKDTGWIDADKELNVFEGKNATGKTTKIDALLWVLCGETIVYGKQDNDNRNKNNLKDIVNVLIELDNGTTLERKYYDVWKDDEYVRTENQFFIGGAKYKKEEFYDYIRTSIGIENNTKVKDFNLLRFLFDYNYFSSIDYKVARKFLEERMHIKSDIEIASQEKYNDIATDLAVQRYEIGKVKSQYKAQKEALRKNIEISDTQLNELREPIDENETLDLINEEIKKQEAVIVDDTNEYKELIIQKKEVASKIELVKKNLEAEKATLQVQEKDIISKGNKIANSIILNEGIIAGLNSNISSLKDKIRLNNDYINTLKETRKAIKCPNCNFILNKDELTTNSAKLNELIESNKNINSTIEKHTTDIQNTQNTINNLKVEKDKLAKEYFDIQSKIKDIQDKIDSSEEINALDNELADINVKGRMFVDNFNKEKQEKLVALYSKRENLSRILMVEKQIADLKSQIAKIEVNEVTLNEFKNEKLENIKSNVSNVFKNVELDLIEYNQNTDVSKDVCYAKLKNVEYNGINDGYKYLLGIQIIEDIKASYGNLTKTPLIFDKFNDIDSDTYDKIRKITNAQIFTTMVKDKEETNNE